MNTRETPAVITQLYARSIRLSEALLIYADVLPDLSPLLKRELELVAAKLNEAASKLHEIGEVHTAKLIHQGGRQ